LKVLATPGLGAFFFDDQAAIAAGAERDGVGYREAGVREPAEAVSIQLVLDDGYVARGDCVSVQYSGAGGREPRLRAGELAPLVERALQEALAGRSLAAFRELAADVEARLPGRAAAYGASQALLDAAAHLAGHHLMARVVMDEWGLPGTAREVPLYAQSGYSDTVRLERWDAGADLGVRHYAQGAELFVLEGEFADDAGSYATGCWLRFPMGSEHHPRSARGCTLYVKRSGLPYLHAAA